MKLCSVIMSMSTLAKWFACQLALHTQVTLSHATVFMNPIDVLTFVLLGY